MKLFNYATQSENVFYFQNKDFQTSYYIKEEENMIKKTIFTILAIILIGGIGFILIPKEQKDNISNTVSSKLDNTR